MVPGSVSHLGKVLGSIPAKNAEENPTYSMLAPSAVCTMGAAIRAAIPFDVQESVAKTEQHAFSSATTLADLEAICLTQPKD